MDSMIMKRVYATCPTRRQRVLILGGNLYTTFISYVDMYVMLDK